MFDFSKNITIPKKDTVHRKKIIDIGEAHDALLDAFHDLIHHPLTTELRGCQLGCESSKFKKSYLTERKQRQLKMRKVSMKMLRMGI